ncbi:MAG: ABC transporter permease [bacterium]|nr:ABC transporter permease [bacterium]
MSQIVRDVRYAVRLLSKSPVVTTVAVLTLALGIGANTAIFSIINALILRSLPVRDPHQLAAVSMVSLRPRSGDQLLSVPMFEEIRNNQQVFSSMFLWAGGGMSNFEANGVTYAASLDRVSGNYYSTLGIQPVLGRLIAPEDVRLTAGSSARVAVIDYRCWQQRYNGDPEVVGQTIRVDGLPLTIIGVSPKYFMGLEIDVASDVIVPIGYDGRTTFRLKKSLWLRVMGRLKPGISLEQAHANLEALWPAVQIAAVPDEYVGEQREAFFARRITVESAATGTSYLRQSLSKPLAVLMVLVGLVLLIACVNLANLTLARVTARRQEIGIRIALGAGGWRLVRQLLTESVILSISGAALGVLAAFWTSRLLLNTHWRGFVPLMVDPAPDLLVLAFTAGVAGLTAVLFGLAPAWNVTRMHPASALQQTARTLRGATGVFGRLLITSQVALSIVLVIGATLFVRSLESLRSVDLGFRREGVLTMDLFAQSGREKIPNRAVYYRELVEELSGLPGVESVSYSHLGPGWVMDLQTPVSVDSSSGAPVEAAKDWVGPGFFRLVEVHLLEGREFDWRDHEQAPRVAIVTANLARRLFPSGSAVSRQINIGTRPEDSGLEIVGVVNSASLWDVRSREPMAVFIPLIQGLSFDQPTMLIRAAGDPWALASSVRRAVESQGHHYPIATRTLEERADMFLREERMIAILSTFFGGLALLLASIGLYGLMSYAVTRRTSEIGLRMALGAQPRNVQRLILREVIWLVSAGIVVGIPIAIGGSRFVSGMLFGISGNDPATIAFSAAVLLGVAVFAGYLPARRASQLDPMTALRSE